MAATAAAARNVTMSSMLRLELAWIGKDQRPKLEPRVLLPDEGKSHHASKRVSEQDSFDNRLIFGDNLLALKALEQEFAGKIKCVYIDPPYNTGAAFEHFDDGVEHSLWLSLMRDRLELLRRLLRDDGSIWISIDDNEAHYLKVLCDEVFGRTNLVASIVASLNPKGRQLDRYFAASHEYILCIAKDIERCDMTAALADEVDLADFPQRDAGGSFRFLPLRNTNKKFNPETRRNLHYPIYFSRLSGAISTQPIDGAIAIKPEFGDGSAAVWRWGKDKVEREIHLVAVREVKRRDGRCVCDVFQKDYCPPERTKKLKSIWLAEAIGSTDEAKEEAKVFNAGDVFPTPKPERLLHRIIQLATRESDLVLDSFAGSGTTGAVAHKMGRRWIMIEQGEHCHTHIIPRLKKVIDGQDPGGVTEATGWKGGGGFRYFRVAPSLMEQDRFGNWVISGQVGPAMLAEAVCKLEGFRYEPSDSVWWQHGRSTENDFLYVTRQTLAREDLQRLSDEVGPQRTLLVMCGAFRCRDLSAFPNLTVKKIPAAVLDRCEWGKDDYSLKVENLPKAPPKEGQMELL